MIVAAKVEIDWDNDTTFTDESAYVVSVTGQSRLQTPASFIASPRGQVSTCTIILSNHSDHFLSGSEPALGTGTQLQMPVRVSATVDAVTTRLFTGVISAMTFSTPSATKVATVTLQCRSSSDYVVLQDRRSTTSAQFAAWADTPPTEEEIIAAFLDNAGLTDGTDYISQAYVAAHGGTATLDPGLFAIRWAWMDEESTLEECWQLAAACGGRLYCNAAGQIVYENMQHWAADTGSTALTRASFVDFALSFDDGELYNSITVETSGRYLAPSEIIWRPDDPVVVPANVNATNGSMTLTARLNQPMYRLDDVSYTSVSHAGASVSTVSESTTQYAQRVVIVFTNTNTSHAALLPDLAITGVVADGRRGEEITTSTAAGYWSGRYQRNRAVRNNPYIQSTAQARALASLLLDWHSAPRLEGSMSGIADPTIGVSERVSITDAELLDSARVFYVLGTAWTLNQAGYNATLQILDASAVAPYQSTSPGYFVIGTSELGAADAQRGRVFY